MHRPHTVEHARPTRWIGVDGGASGFRAYEVCVVSGEGRARLCLGAHRAAESIEPVAGFAPLSIEEQRAQAARGECVLAPHEQALQGRWIHAASRAIWRVAAALGPGAVRVGICAPGLKTADRRGIAQALNGPRIPDFLDALEQSLVLDGVDLAGAIGELHSDGLASAVGEDLASEGLLGDCSHAYYLGGGSGVSEAYKLGGRVVSADELEPEVVKAWRIPAVDGNSFEHHLSAAGINRDFGLSARTIPAGARTPERAAAEGESKAIALFAARGERLAELCATRLVELNACRGVVLERIVVGQRLGGFLADPALESSFAAPARRKLAELIAANAPELVRRAWLTNGALAAGSLQASGLRAAAALGSVALSMSERP